MKTQTTLSEVTIQISSKPVLTMPKSLSAQLGVRQGDKVSVQVYNGTLRVRKNGHRKTVLAHTRAAKGVAAALLA